MVGEHRGLFANHEQNDGKGIIMWNRLCKTILVLAVLAMGVGEVSAEVVLRFAPADTTVELGSITRLSVMCDEVLELRTIEVYIEFDPEIVGSVSGGAGALFTEHGFNLFQGFELSEPNVWHGYCVVMGSADFATTPGELFYWEFEGLADGVSPITTVSVGLAAADATILPDVSLPPTTIVVGSSLSPVSEVPFPEQSLRCFPNPFNPRTEIQFELKKDEAVNLDVFNLAGQRVVRLYQGQASKGQLSVSWDGCDEQGRSQPGGLYLFRLETPTILSVTKGVLVK